MAYAAYREHPGVVRTTNTTVFKVLDVTVPSVDACCVRRAIASCPGVGVLRCEPLRHAGAAGSSAAPRVRLMIRLPLERYADLLHRLLESVPGGEIGHLVSWRDHLKACGVAHGG